MSAQEELKELFIEIISSPHTEVTDRNIQEFNSLVEKENQDSEKKELARYIDIWQTIPLLQRNYDSGEAFEKIRSQLDYQNNNNNNSKTWSVRKRSIVFSGIAAAVLISFLFLTLPYLKTKVANKKVTFSEYHVPYGSRSKITLPDGTLVWLNAGSTLRYPSNYSYKERQVHLEGEAFFEVTKIPGKSFIATTKSAAVKVLGTSFNLKAYPEENRIETTVTTGTVEVSNTFSSEINSKKIILKANEKVSLKKSLDKESLPHIIHDSSHTISKTLPNHTVDTKSEIIISRDIDPNVSSSWKEDEWIIESESLSEFAIKMERRFDVTIHFTDRQVQEYIFSGRLKDENLNQMLEAISKTAPISYEIKDDEVYLSKRYED